MSICEMGSLRRSSSSISSISPSFSSTSSTGRGYEQRGAACSDSRETGRRSAWAIVFVGRRRGRCSVRAGLSFDAAGLGVRRWPTPSRTSLVNELLAVRGLGNTHDVARRGAVCSQALCSVVYGAVAHVRRRRRQPQGPAISNRPCLHRGHAARASGAYCNYCSEANVFSEWNVPRKTRVGVPSW